MFYFIFYPFVYAILKKLQLKCEKGINLSGGQKQRVSLARCIYSNADVYFLDDTLSAVDAHVGKHIFDSVIGPNGVLKDKTRIFVTNSLSFLPQSDKILMMENGSIVGQGTYDELMQKKGDSFSKYLKHYLDGKEANIEGIKTLQTQVSQVSEKVKREISVKNEVIPKETAKKDKDIGKTLIQKEKIASGNIGSSIFLSYFRACRLKMIVIYFILYSLGNMAQIGSSFWLSNWTNNSDLASTDQFFQFGIFALLGVINCGLIFVGDMFFANIALRTAKHFHESLLYSILRSGMQFFESTPIGRILNRLNKDIEATENKIPETFRTCMTNWFSCLRVIVAVSISSPFLIVIFIPLSAVYFIIQVKKKVLIKKKKF